MRNFFINALDKLVGVIVILGGIVVLLATGAALFGSGPQSGIPAAVAILVGGTIYLILTGGFLYLALGIYHNTRRTAELLEDIAPSLRS